ncbi:hypothetical protein [Methylicorpusculum sp.]|uniref:hypothetical protein n=1 Tax=Methylicorpusculum sp. TaxID=2713644 RepID=UPI00271A8B4D|nr:hypothetical protein [Methylicorpusculum sp.]MDO8844751.1 hypothetical protein [Methylicorpusculum sp.]MDP2178806.1 hypothetical protein [Methylicorpusculum sp.]MDP3529124.1 hypothetical protein [Methylicorpusculum sp.]MDZ4151199.1 hypothetical protein [Methylicorpusculum sp.]
MTMISESIKSTIQSRLLEMVESRHELIKHAKFLSDLGISVKESRLYIGECFESVAENYLFKICSNLSAQHAKGTPAKVSLNSDWYKVITNRNRRESFVEQFWSPTDDDLDADKALIGLYLAEVQFDAIVSSINEQVGGLEEKGLNILANKIIDRLNLKCERHYYEPYKKAGRIICQTWSVNYHDAYSKIDELVALKDAFSIIENESGVSFGVAISEYISAINELNWSRAKISSRSAFGKGGHLEIVCFKEKHEYRFSIQAFNALVAFLMLNGEAEAAHRIIEKTGLQEAA